VPPLKGQIADVLEKENLILGGDELPERGGGRGGKKLDHEFLNGCPERTSNVPAGRPAWRRGPPSEKKTHPGKRGEGLTYTILRNLKNADATSLRVREPRDYYF